MEEIILSDNGKKLLRYMQTHDRVLVGKDLVELTGIKGIYPVLNSLKRKNIVREGSPVIRDFTNSNGITKPKEYKTYELTDFGRFIDLSD